MRRTAALLLLIGGLLLAFTAAGVAEALRTPVVARYDVGLADWPPAQRPLTIVQLSDLHVGWPDMPPERVARIVAQANALKPDLIVVTGDYDGGKLWDRRLWLLEDKLGPLAGLRAPLGVHVVLGNHDDRFWSERVFGKQRMRVLDNEVVDVGPLAIAGMRDRDQLAQPERAMVSLVASAPPGKPLLLLSHQPEVFASLPPRVDLLIAGHTHGGQLCLPLIGCASLNPYLAAHRRGLFVEGGRRMIVSSGLGTTFVPLRLGVPPEIVEIRLHSVGRKSGTER